MPSLEEEKQARIEKFKKMGMPIPIDKHLVEQTQVSIKNQNFFSKLQAIKQGANRALNSEIINQGVKNPPSFQPLGENKSKNHTHKGEKKMDAPTLENFTPAASPNEFGNVDDMFSSASPSASFKNNKNTIDRSLLQSYSVNENDTGREFTSNIQDKFRNKMAEKGVVIAPKQVHENQQPSNFIQTTTTQLHSGMILIDEAELTKKIADIAKGVSEKMIKAVLNEYMKNDKELIVENDKVKKVEIVGKDIVRMEGKTFKLVPVTIKQVKPTEALV